MKEGFYKLENTDLLYAPNAVYNKEYTLLKENSQDYVYPIDGWTWFDSLEDVLQELLNTGKLQELFVNHYTTATGLNGIQDATGYSGVRAMAVAGREFVIDENGKVTLVPLPIPEPEELNNTDELIQEINVESV